MLLRRSLAMALAAVVAAGAVSALTPPKAAVALSASDFDPGLIIADELFYDSAAMTAAEIQAFLDQKVGTCQTDRCLNVAVVPVASRAPSYSVDTGGLVCSAIEGGSLRVSELIYRTQAACGISAKVILVTLQKEQGLVTSRAPSDWALRAAMGMGCPDTAPCNDAFAGLATQIISGARQLHVYKVGRFGRQPGVQFVQYHPNAACGGTTVNVRNHATAALYNYTPYQPNAAALANLSGTGDGCSSYGNRNFWRFYNQWFGPSVEIICVSNPSRDISQFWADQGGASGALGAPVAPGVVIGAGGLTVGYYSNGQVYCTPRIGAIPVTGDIAGAYTDIGAAASTLGAPRAAQSAFSAGGVEGRLQEFQQGSMLSSASTGTYAVIHGPIRNAWGALGGSGGTLGWPTGNQSAVEGGIQQQFQRGALMVPTGQAAIVLEGEIASYWFSGSNASALGSPTSPASSWTAGGVTGRLQYFSRGMVMSSSTTGVHAVLNGPVRNAWGAEGGSGGALGWPTGDQQSVDGGYRQDFQSGTISTTVAGVAGIMSGAIADYWRSGGHASSLGLPLGTEIPWVAGGVSGKLQDFERGTVLSSAATGTHAVLHGPIRDAWGAQGGSGGALGWPTGDQETVAGSIRQQFQRGLVDLSTGLTGAIAAYVATGSNSSKLGAATSAQTAWEAGGVTGSLQYFARGTVLSSASTGTYAVLNGRIRDAWGDAGGSGGSLGWPTSDQTSVSGGIRQEFQHGAVFAPTSGASVILSGAIGEYWSEGSNAQRLGNPTSSPTAWSAGGLTGTLQYFSRGTVLSSTVTGTYAVLDGSVRVVWGAEGGTGGSLGWPVGDQESISGGVKQKFQSGAIVVPQGGAGAALIGEMGVYWEAGSRGTLMGLPTSARSALTASGVSGWVQYFERSILFSSGATGTHAVLNGPIRNAWGGLGGSGGSLGWPAGDQQATTGGVHQRFQRGVVSVPTNGATVLVTDSYFDYWASGSNAAALGAPTGSRVSWTAGGVSGSYQSFDGGMVMSSPTTGMNAVLNGPIRTAWGARDGSGGALGWPIADQEAIEGGAQQRFQHGTVIAPSAGDAYVVMN